IEVPPASGAAAKPAGMSPTKFDGFVVFLLFLKSIPTAPHLTPRQRSEAFFTLRFEVASSPDDQRYVDQRQIVILDEVSYDAVGQHVTILFAFGRNIGQRLILQFFGSLWDCRLRTGFCLADRVEDSESDKHQQSE